MLRSFKALQHFPEKKFRNLEMLAILFLKFCRHWVGQITSFSGMVEVL